MRPSALKNNHGFSLIELMMVIAIISALASIALPNYLQYREKAYEVSCLSNRRHIEINAKARYAEDGEFESELIDIYTCPRQGIYVWMSTDPDSSEFAKVLCSLHGATSAHEAEPLTSLGSTFGDISDGMIGLIEDFYEKNGNYPRSWGDYRFADIDLDPEEWSIPYSGIVYTPVGNRINISPDEGFTFYVTDTTGEELKLESSYNWNLVYSVEDGEWYFKEIAENNKIDISTLKVEKK